MRPMQLQSDIARVAGLQAAAAINESKTTDSDDSRSSDHCSGASDTKSLHMYGEELPLVTPQVVEERV
ncbi:hypothetical protein NDU88_002515 [Pleurodeles waltl]|uniref:Uncharacterized protein n=1 Tax=Pleurodeles waltl TaxID=8319 RepID=A0AAV7QA52_PLEWA|nr:hypothetical protein NDU88_002515 [Pleurodeles waltl]